MARPTKQGIDYFPVDVQFDDQLELLITEKGGIALAVIITLWQLIYQNQGYYIENGDDLTLLVKKRILVETDIIRDVINAALNRNIFDKDLHQKYKILTSRGIQKRYITAARLKKNIVLIKNYLLIDVSNVGNATYIEVNSVGNATNVKEDVKEEEDIKEYIAESSDEQSLPQEDIFITIPLIDKTEYPVSEKLVKEFQELYPAIDVQQCLRDIKAWNIANKKNRKTKQGILRHINTWLKKAQDKAPRIEDDYEARAKAFIERHKNEEKERWT